VPVQLGTNENESRKTTKEINKKNTKEDMDIRNMQFEEAMAIVHDGIKSSV